MTVIQAYITVFSSKKPHNKYWSILGPLIRQKELLQVPWNLCLWVCHRWGRVNSYPQWIWMLRFILEPGEIRRFTALWFFTVIYCSLISVLPFLSPKHPFPAGRWCRKVGQQFVLLCPAHCHQSVWLANVPDYPPAFISVHHSDFQFTPPLSDLFPSQDHHPFLSRLPSFWSHFLGTSLFIPVPQVSGFPNPNSLCAEAQCVVSLVSSISVLYLFIYWRIENMMLLL